MFGKKQPVTKEKVMEALKDCYDPEIPLNIVDLGLVYGVDVKGGDVHIDMTLTAVGCPIGGYMTEEVAERVRQLDGVKGVTVELVWDPPWTPDRVSAEGKAFLGL